MRIEEMVDGASYLVRDGEWLTVGEWSGKHLGFWLPDEDSVEADFDRVEVIRELNLEALADDAPNEEERRFNTAMNECFPLGENN